MKRAATEWAERALDFEKNVRDALLDTAGVMDVVLRLPVPAEGRHIVRGALDQLEAGDALPAQSISTAALHDAVERCIEGYESDIKAKTVERLEESGTKLPKGISPPGVSPLERTALKSFVLWSILQDIKSRRGQRGADLDAASEAFGD